MYLCIFMFKFTYIFINADTYTYILKRHFLDDNTPEQVDEDGDSKKQHSMKDTVAVNSNDQYSKKIRSNVNDVSDSKNFTSCTFSFSANPSW